MTNTRFINHHHFPVFLSSSMQRFLFGVIFLRTFLTNFLRVQGCRFSKALCVKKMPSFCSHIMIWLDIRSSDHNPFSPQIAYRYHTFVSQAPPVLLMASLFFLSITCSFWLMRVKLILEAQNIHRDTSLCECVFSLNPPGTRGVR